MSKPVHVSIVVFPECDPSIVYGVFDTLWAAGRAWAHIKGGGQPLFEPRLVAAEAGPMALVTGVSVIPQDAIADVRRTDIVFVPNVMIDTAENVRMLDRRTIGWIREMHAGGAQLCAACGGVLVLAEAGLLDGGQATTHWAYAPLFRQLFPNVTLHVERLLVQSGPGHNVVCSGGASSWQDLALLLVAKHGGTEEAIRMSMMENANHGDGIILHCQQWIAQHYERQDIIAQLVRESGLPKRSFDRRFRAATGYSPLAYIQTLRIEEAKQLLETSTVAVENIGREVGYEDAASFRRLFRRLAGMAPGDYRRKFQPPSIVEQVTPARASQPRSARPANRETGRDPKRRGAGIACARSAVRGA
jgi:transcriptional regulator GlxA family with amidase domain